MEDVDLLIGAPPGSYKGLHSIRAFRYQAKTKLFKCLTGIGAYASNRNLSGIIQLSIMPESPLHGALQIQDLAGVGFPVYATDRGTNGSSFINSTSSRVMYTPEWTKERGVRLIQYTIECKRLIITGGIRKVVR